MTTKKEVVSTVFKLAKHRFGANKYIDKNTTFEMLKFDRFDVCYIVMACEEKFEIQIPIAEVGAIKDVKTLVNVVCGKLKDLGRLVIPERKPKEDVPIEDDVKVVAKKLDLNEEQTKHLQDKLKNLEESIKFNSAAVEKFDKDVEVIEENEEKCECGCNGNYECSNCDESKEQN